MVKAIAEIYEAKPLGLVSFGRKSRFLDGCFPLFGRGKSSIRLELAGKSSVQLRDKIFQSSVRLIKPLPGCIKIPAALAG
jgi:hypothetical protein